jgi:ribonuclease HI
MKKVQLYTDGACSGNPGSGGYAIILRYGDVEKVICGGEAMTTNNRMELMAVIVGLEALSEQCEVEVYTDSRYITDAINKGWAESWKANNWLKKDKQPALNVDLWERLLAQVSEHLVKFVWIRGHHNHPLNVRCDRLAVAQSKIYKRVNN